MDRREMLREYFMLEISEAGEITSISHLLKGYTPNLDKLPLFLMRLGPQVRLPRYRSTHLTYAMRPP